MTKAKIVLAAIVWLIVLAAGISVWKLLIQPRQQQAAAQKEDAQREASLARTQGTSKYATEIAIGLDAFSGYALFRSDTFQSLLADKGIKIRLRDDAADYAARAKALESGDLQLALFPADALIKASAKLDALPATIVAVIDETRGADAMLGYRQKYPNLDALNAPETRFVLVGDSPSETLARVVMHDFDLRRLAPQPFVTVASPEEVLARYRAATPQSTEVFLTWEPYVSQLLANDQLHVVVDSSRFTGYIVDCLVVSRDYLLKHQSEVETLLECYFRCLYEYRQEGDMVKLVLADAKKTDQALTTEQATRLVAGIQWKNTQENLAHFGLRSGELKHVEDIIGRIMTVLVETHAIAGDPTQGQWNRLFFDAPLASLQTRNFHPGLKSETLREQASLGALDEAGWKRLVPVGTLSVPELVFARGSATLTDASRLTLDELAAKLQSWPQYYLEIQGDTVTQGDAAANRALADRRAATAFEYLLSLGMNPARLRTVTGAATGQTRVVFRVGQLPY